MALPRTPLTTVLVALTLLLPLAPVGLSHEDQSASLSIKSPSSPVSWAGVQAGEMVPVTFLVVGPEDHLAEITLLAEEGFVVDVTATQEANAGSFVVAPGSGIARPGEMVLYRTEVAAPHQLGPEIVEVEPVVVYSQVASEGSDSDTYIWSLRANSRDRTDRATLTDTAKLVVDNRAPTAAVLVGLPPFQDASDIDLSWTAPTDIEAGDTGLAEVRVDRTNPDGSQETVKVFTDTTTSSYLDKDLADGLYIYEIVAVDEAGNEARSDQVSTTVDTTAPTVLISSPADDAILGSQDVNLAFTVDDAHLDTVACELDGNGYQPCQPTYTLTDGTHSLAVRATDGAGNTATDTVTFTVDTTAPTVSISSPTAGDLLANDQATVTFSATDPHLDEVTCELTGATPQGPHDCTGDTEVTFNNLDEGDHTATITATDKAGNMESATVTFTVDTTAPTGLSLEGLPTYTSSDEVDLSWTEPTDTTTAVEEIQIQRKGPSEASFTTVATLTDPKQTTYKDTGLSDGEQTYKVVAVDKAGNEAPSNQVSTTVDTTAPTVSISSPTAGDLLANDQATVTFSATDPHLDEVTCELTGATPQGPHDCTGDTEVTFNNLDDGDHTATITAIDRAGHSATETVTFTVDMTPPTVSISSPADDAILGSQDVNLAFTVDDAHLDTVACELDGNGFQPCQPTYTLTDGTHSLAVRATDGAGNTATDTVTFTVDTTAPAGLSLDALPTYTGTTQVELSWSEPTDDSSDIQEIKVERKAPGEASFATVATLPQGTTAYTDDLATSEDGLHEYRLLARDGAGNTAHSNTVSTTLDTTVPTISALHHPRTVEVGQPFTLSAHLEDTTSGLQSATWSWNGQVLSTEDLGGASSADIDIETSLPRSGTQTVTLTAVDAAGHEASSSFTIRVEKAPGSGGGFSGGGGSAGSTSPTSPTDQGTQDTSQGDSTGDQATGPSAPEPVTVEAETVSDGGGNVFRATTLAKAGQQVLVRVPQAGLDVQVVPSSEGELETTVTRGIPEGTPTLPRTVLSAADISVTGPSSGAALLDSASVTFAVAQGALEEANAGPGDVTIYHHNGDFWDLLDTTYLGLVDGEHRFRAATDSFSPFAVALKEPAVDGVGDGPLVLKSQARGDHVLHQATFQTDGREAQLVAPDHGLELVVTPPEPGTFTLFVRAYQDRPAHVPDAAVAYGTYYDLNLQDADGAPVEPASAVLAVDVPEEALGSQGTAQQLVVAHAQQARWVPVDTEVLRQNGVFQVRGQLSSFSSYGVLLDTQAPSVGLEERLDTELTRPVDVTVVASDNVAVSSVTLLVDGVEHAVDDQAPFVFRLDPARIGVGEHTLTFTATDASGNPGSTIRTVTVPQASVLPGATVEQPDGSDEDLTPAETGQAGDDGDRVGWWTLGLVLAAMAVVAVALAVAWQVRSRARPPGA